MIKDLITDKTYLDTALATQDGVWSQIRLNVAAGQPCPPIKFQSAKLLLRKGNHR